VRPIKLKLFLFSNFTDYVDAVTHNGRRFLVSTWPNRMFRIVSVAWVNLGCIAGDGCQNLNEAFGQVPEQTEFTYIVLLRSCRASLKVLCSY